MLRFRCRFGNFGADSGGLFDFEFELFWSGLIKSFTVAALLELFYVVVRVLDYCTLLHFWT